MKYNHMYDVAFTVISDNEEPTYEELIAGLFARFGELVRNPDEEAFGHCDTYTFENPVYFDYPFGVDVNTLFHTHNGKKYHILVINHSYYYSIRVTENDLPIFGFRPLFFHQNAIEIYLNTRLPFKIKFPT